jgi:fatty acid desaturase
MIDANKIKIPKYQEQVIPEVENLLKSLLLISFLLSFFALTQAGVNTIDVYFLGEWLPFNFFLKAILIFVMAIVNAMLVIGLAALAHEGTHRILFRSKFLNDFWGGILAAFLLFPAYGHRDFHLKHHAYAHQPGEDTQEPMENLPFWLMMTGGLLLGLYSQYKFMFENLFYSSWERRFRGLKDIFFVSIIATLYFYLLPLAGISFWYTVIPMLNLGFPLVFSLRNYTDHGGLPAQFHNSSNPKNKIKVDSWIIISNPFMEWLWSSINYHQVHHRYPYLSHRYLKPVFEATKDEQPYLVIEGYFRALKWLKDRPYYGDKKELQQFLTTSPLATLELLD